MGIKGEHSPLWLTQPSPALGAFHAGPCHGPVRRQVVSSERKLRPWVEQFAEGHALRPWQLGGEDKPWAPCLALGSGWGQ